MTASDLAMSEEERCQTDGARIRDISLYAYNASKRVAPVLESLVQQRIWRPAVCLCSAPSSDGMGTVNLVSCALGATHLFLPTKLTNPSQTACKA